MERAYREFYYDPHIKAFMSYSSNITLIEINSLSEVAPFLFRVIKHLYRCNFYRHIDDIHLTNFKRLDPCCWIKIDKSHFPKDELQTIFDLEHKDLDVYVDNRFKRVLFISSNHIFFLTYKFSPDENDKIVPLEHYIK